MMILHIGSYLRLESGTSGVTDAFSDHNFPLNEVLYRLNP